MKTKYRFIHFLPVEKDFASFGEWICHGNKDDVKLGVCEYYSPWKQWQFVPAGENVAFTADCLRDIAHFMQQLPKL